MEHNFGRINLPVVLHNIIVHKMQHSVRIRLCECQKARSQKCCGLLALPESRSCLLKTFPSNTKSSTNWSGQTTFMSRNAHWICFLGFLSFSLGVILESARDNTAFQFVWVFEIRWTISGSFVFLAPLMFSFIQMAQSCLDEKASDSTPKMPRATPLSPSKMWLHCASRRFNVDELLSGEGSFSTMVKLYLFGDLF